MIRRFKIAACAALCALSFASAAETATPEPLTAADVLDEGKAITLTLPDATQHTLNGPRTHPAPGMVGLVARSATGAARLYAFVVDGQLMSADAYGSFGHQSMMPLAAKKAARAYDVQPTDEVTLPASAPKAYKPAAKAAPGPDGKYEIRVLILYTPLAAARLGTGQMRAHAERLIFVANGVMQTSMVPVRYTVAGVSPFADTTEDDDYYANLDALAGSASVGALRNQAQADLVMLFRSQDGKPTGRGGLTLCGLSGGFNSMDDSDPPLSVDADRDGFSVAGVAPSESGFTCGDLIVAHEMGHSLAGGHDYASSGGFAYWKPYSHASACQDAEGEVAYYSLMWGGGTGPGRSHGDVITNPDLILDGRSCGADGDPQFEASQANNAKAMTEAAPYVAAYRGPTQSAAGAGEGGGESASGGGSLSFVSWMLLMLGGALRITRRDAILPQARCSRRL